MTSHTSRPNVGSEIAVPNLFDTSRALMPGGAQTRRCLCAYFVASGHQVPEIWASLNFVIVSVGLKKPRYRTAWLHISWNEDAERVLSRRAFFAWIMTILFVFSDNPKKSAI